MVCTHAMLVYGAKYRGSCVLVHPPLSNVFYAGMRKTLDYKSKWITIQHQSGDIAVTYIEK